MKTILMMLILLLSAVSSVFAESLPCQEESVEMDYFARRMYGDGYSAAEYTEFETQSGAWEMKYVACINDYEIKNGEQARIDLVTKLIDVTQQINNARRDS